MSFARLAAILLTLGLLNGCGFTPMYGSAGSANRHQVQSTLNNIAIENIPNREGQYLRNRLIDRFYTGGNPDSPDYTLVLSPVTESKYNLDITKDANATRAELRVGTTMVLRDRASGAALLTRSLAASTSYNILASQFTTRVSEDNARLNALDALARQAEQAVVLYFERQGK
ncbi:MAG: LPS assembly lipoprotein LptE [Micavibrio sp.]